MPRIKPKTPKRNDAQTRESQNQEFNTFESSLPVGRQAEFYARFIGCVLGDIDPAVFAEAMERVAHCEAVAARKAKQAA